MIAHLLLAALCVCTVLAVHICCNTGAAFRIKLPVAILHAVGVGVALTKLPANLVLVWGAVLAAAVLYIICKTFKGIIE